MQWGGDVSIASIELWVFWSGVHGDMSPSDFNEWHMLDKEN